MWLVVKIKSTYITVSLFYFTILIEKFHHLLLSQWWVKLKPSRLIWFSCEWLWYHASTWTLLVVVAGIFHSQFFMFCWRAATFAWVFIRILMHSRSGGKTRNVVECSSYTFVLRTLPACFTTGQSADKASLFVSYKTTSSIEICWCVLDMYRISSKLRLPTSVWTIVAANKRKRNEITRIRTEGWKPICSLQWKWSSSMQ